MYESWHVVSIWEMFTVLRWDCSVCCLQYYIDGLVQYCSISSSLAMDIWYSSLAPGHQNLFESIIVFLITVVLLWT